MGKGHHFPYIQAVSKRVHAFAAKIYDCQSRLGVSNAKDIFQVETRTDMMRNSNLVCFIFMKPLLSICIPTLNRSELLRVLLKNLEREAGAFLGRVEIVVADNASADDTSEVVRQSPLPIVYGRQETTSGFTRNILFSTATLASGEFVWVIGDDDLVLPGGIRRVLESIHDVPSVNYHYLNFGWVDFWMRERIIVEGNGQPHVAVLNRLQCKDTTWRCLQRLEDLVFLPSENPSALFSGIFCFVTRRQYYVDAEEVLQPSNSLDGSSTLIADCFPHAMLSLPRVAGKPVAYIGTPCILQGISGWEWGAYANKNMIFGTHQFFEWLQMTSFAGDAMEKLWESYFHMAGRLFFRMLFDRDEHKGMDIVLKKAIPDSSSHLRFWGAFMEESKLKVEAACDATNLARWVERLLSGKKQTRIRIGLWGVLGVGQAFLKLSPHLKSNLVWIADRNESQQGRRLEGTELETVSPETLHLANLDVLVIGARWEFVNEILGQAAPQLRHDAVIVSVQGPMKASALAYSEQG